MVIANESETEQNILPQNDLSFNLLHTYYMKKVYMYIFSFIVMKQ